MICSVVTISDTACKFIMQVEAKFAGVKNHAEQVALNMVALKIKSSFNFKWAFSKGWKRHLAFDKRTDNYSWLQFTTAGRSLKAGLIAVGNNPLPTLSQLSRSPTNLTGCISISLNAALPITSANAFERILNLGANQSLWVPRYCFSFHMAKQHSPGGILVLYLWIKRRTMVRNPALIHELQKISYYSKKPVRHLARLACESDYSHISFVDIRNTLP